MLLENIDSLCYELFLDDEYQKTIHRAKELLHVKKDLSSLELKFYEALINYATGSELWEKSYNYDQITTSLTKAEVIFGKLISEAASEELKLFLQSFEVVTQQQIIGVAIENGMLANNSTEMVHHSARGIEISEKILHKLKNGDHDFFESLYDYINDYFVYFRGVNKYATMMDLWKNNRDSFLEQYNDSITYLDQVLLELREMDSTINLTELQAMTLGLKRAKQLLEQSPSQIKVKDSEHLLSISFYIGQTFAEHLHKTFSSTQSSQPLEDLFHSKFEVVASGVDELDDFLETDIGKKFGDNLHLVFGEGNIEVLGKQFSFQPEIFIRKFGTCTVQFHLKINDQILTVSDLRTLQTLVAPQCGTSKITIHGQTYQRFINVVEFIYNCIAEYHDTKWEEKKMVLRDFWMNNVDFQAERTWYSRSLLREVGIEKDNEYSIITDFNQIVSHPEFKAFTLPLYEGKITLEDWIHYHDKPWQNLAEIRSHIGDMITATKHTFIGFLPENAEFMNQGILAATQLVNDIATLIISFDVMAEKVRGSLIYYVNDSKQALETAQIKKIKENLDRIRKKQIEITEFELLAMQAVQLLKSQESLLYVDHSEFIGALIENTEIDNTIENLQAKLTMIKESQAGILQTADDLVAKYQEKVTENQQRLIRVATLIIAGFGQISLVDTILANLNITNEQLRANITQGVTIFGMGLAGLAILWLLWAFLRSRTRVFDFSED